MSEFLDFTYDSKRFKKFSNFIHRIHRDNVKLVPIVDPGISNNLTRMGHYPPLDEGLDAQIFIIDRRTGLPLNASVWPGTTFFPDFTNPEAVDYWADQHVRWHKEVKFDGIWNDMNEPSNFNDGSVTACDENELNHPPYNPLFYDKIYSRTVCLDAVQHLGTHYSLHNMYGYWETRATNAALRRIFPGKRPYVLSRSTFMGSGKHTAHWTGDNRSEWPQMKLSIITSLEFNMFGIPWVGADVCGFGGEATEELCVRWHQLGSFYPFFRNHNDIGNKVDQDPAAWSPQARMIIQNAILTRYQLIPYLYTLFQSAHINGSTVMRPVFFEFPTDPKTWGIDDQFFWGSSIMIAPILTPNTTKRSVYFPAGRWYNGSGLEVSFPNNQRNITEEIRYDSTGMGVYIRGGSVLPIQVPAVNTAAARRNPLLLLVFLDNSSSACGSLIWDDGESLSTYELGLYLKLDFEVSQRNGVGFMTITQVHNGLQPLPLQFVSVAIFGVSAKPTTVIANGAKLVDKDFVYDERSQSLQLTGNFPLNNYTKPVQTIQWY